MVKRMNKQKEQLCNGRSQLIFRGYRGTIAEKYR